MIVNIEPYVGNGTRLVNARLRLLGWLSRGIGVTLVDRAERFAPAHDSKAPLHREDRHALRDELPSLLPVDLYVDGRVIARATVGTHYEDGEGPE